jgi:hypothetical protein
MATKKKSVAKTTQENKQEPLFTKEQILTSKKYADKRDVCNAVLPADFCGSLADADTLIQNFMKRKVM